MLSSVTSLTATLRWAHAEHVDFRTVAAEQATTFGRQCDQLVAADRAGILPPERIVHVRFDDFLADQAGTVESIWAQLGLPVDDEARAAVRAYLADRPQGRLGGHSHSFDDLGLDATQFRERFAEYQHQFSISSETR